MTESLNSHPAWKRFSSGATGIHRLKRGTRHARKRLALGIAPLLKQGKPGERTQASHFEQSI